MLSHPHVLSVHLVGSRARGTATPLSDWDFTVRVDDFASVAPALPSLVSVLEPLAQQWDRLGPVDYSCYMLMLAGPVKIDLIFPDVPHRPEPPWAVEPGTLPGIDAHFWDWTLWLAAKRAAGRTRLVAEQLTSMSHHLLRPMGVDTVPGSIQDAVDTYLAARGRLESRFDIRIPRRLEGEVRPVVERA
jgi:Nucleotidyltransferase domain